MVIVTSDQQWRCFCGGTGAFLSLNTETRHSGPYLKSHHSWRLRQEDPKFQPSLDNLTIKWEPVSKNKNKRAEDEAQCKRPGLNPQYYVKKRKEKGERGNKGRTRKGKALAWTNHTQFHHNLRSFLLKFSDSGFFPTIHYFRF